MSINIKSPHEYLNATVVGTPTISEGVVSGFSTSSYLVINNSFVPSNSTWEKCFKFNTGDFTTSTTGSIYSHGTADKTGDTIIYNSGKLRLVIGYTGSAWDVDQTSSVTLNANTDYWVKVIFNGTQYLVELSTDGKNFDNIITVASTTIITADVSKMVIGERLGYSIPLTTGSIDLNESYIKINGEYWWRGVEIDQYREIKRLYQYKEPTYYKYGTEIDATVTGSFGRLDKGVASGFSASNYLTLPEVFNPLGSDFEAVFKVKQTAAENSPILVQSDTTTFHRIFLYVSAIGVISFNVGNNSSWLLKLTSNIALELNKDYWIKFAHKDGTYYIYYSLDGVDYVLDNSITSTTNILALNKAAAIGYSSDSSTGKRYFAGSIYLSESYININGERWWSGDSYTKVGSWIDDGVISGFTSANYLTAPTFAPNSDTWEMKIKINMTSSTSNHDYLWTSIADGYGFIFGLNANKFIIFASSNGSSWNIFTGTDGTHNIALNTDYFVKFGWNGTEYYVEYSLDDVDYTRDITIASTTAIYQNTAKMKLGDWLTYGIADRSSIDLTKSYIKINNKMWWHGTKAEETTADDYEWFEKIPMTIKQVYKTDKTKYYKYVTEYEDWTQPVATSNTTAVDGGNMVFTDSYNNTTTAAWKAMNNNNSNNQNCWVNNGTGAAWWQVKFPYILKITGLKHANASTTGTARNVNGQFYTDSTMTTPIGDAISTPNTNVYETTISGIPSEGILTDTIYFRKTGGGAYGGIGELKITATKQVITTTGVKEVPFTFPELTSEGSIGGDEYGVQALDDRVIGLMNMFQPLVNGKPANGVYADLDNVNGSGIISFAKLYSPVPFVLTKVEVYAGLNDDGTVIENTGLFSLQTHSDDGILTDSYFGGYGFEDGKKEINFTPKEPCKYITLGCMSVSEEDADKIGKIIISGYTEEPLTADDDYDYKELIPQLVYEDNSTVFQQSTAGTYTFNVTEEAPYEITLVGGGGGGAFNSSGNAGSAAAGNSGSGLVVNAVLKAGTYVLNVGAGGAWSGWLDANTWGGNGSQSSISKDGVVIATAGGGTGNHAWWRSGSAHNSTVGAAPTYTDALGVRDVILNTQGNWGGLAATSSGGASVISGTTWGKGGDTRNRNAADNGNAGCIRIVRLEK